MPQDTVITGAQFAGALVEGGVLAVVLVAVTHLLLRYERQILFGVLLVAALAYVGFAIGGGAGAGWLLIELVGVAIYGTLGWIGLRGSLWWLAAAWALHPIWDLGLHYFGAGSSFASPLSYPIPCLSFDLVVAAYLAYRASRQLEPAAASGSRLRQSHSSRG